MWRTKCGCEKLEKKIRVIKLVCQPVRSRSGLVFFSSNGENWFYIGCILETELTGFAEQVDEYNEKERNSEGH